MNINTGRTEVKDFQYDFDLSKATCYHNNEKFLVIWSLFNACNFDANSPIVTGWKEKLALFLVIKLAVEANFTITLELEIQALPLVWEEKLKRTLLLGQLREDTFWSARLSQEVQLSLRFLSRNALSDLLFFVFSFLTSLSTMTRFSTS